MIPDTRKGIGGFKRPKDQPEYLRFAYFAGPHAAMSDAIPDERLFQDPSGMVRYEQPDNEARSTVARPEDYPATYVDRNVGKVYNEADIGGNVMSLGDLYSHPTLYKDYPHMADMPVMLLPSLGTSVMGSFGTPEDISKGAMDEYFQFMEDPEAAKAAVSASKYGAFLINPAGTFTDGKYKTMDLPEFIRKILGHETQHGIDYYEGAQYEGDSTRYETRPGEFVARMVSDRMDLPEDDRFSNIQYYVTDPMREGAVWTNPIPEPGIWETLTGPDSEALRALLKTQREKD